MTPPRYVQLMCCATYIPVRGLANFYCKGRRLQREMALMRSRRGDFLAELQNVTVDVADRELSHAVVEVFDRIDNGGLVAKLGPQRIDIVDMKIKGASEKGLLEGNMLV